MNPAEYGYISVFGMGIFAAVVWLIVWNQDRREKRKPPPAPPTPKLP